MAASIALGTLPLSLVGDDAALDEWADQLVAVATEHGFPFFRAQGTIFIAGWVKVENRNVTEGISLLRSGLAAFRSTGAAAWLPYYISLLARACDLAGQLHEAVTLLDEASQTAERTGERWLEAELSRHKGRLLLRQGHAEAAEELYLQSPEYRAGAGSQSLGIACIRKPCAPSLRPGSRRRSA